jgi:hypothetical protein
MNNINHQIHYKNIVINNICQKNKNKKYDNNKNMININNDCQSHLVGCESTFYSRPSEQHHTNDNHIKLTADEEEKVFDRFIDNHMIYFDRDWGDLMFYDDDEDDDEKRTSSEGGKKNNKKEGKKNLCLSSFLERNHSMASFKIYRRTS